MKIRNSSSSSSSTRKFRIKLNIDKRKVLLSVLVAFLILLTLSSIFLAYSYKTPLNRSIVKTTRYADLYVVSDTKFIVKPALIYDYKTIIDGTKTYYNLVKETLIRLTLGNKIYSLPSVGKPVEIKISWTKTAYIKTSEWEKEVPVNSSILNNKVAQYTVEFRINMFNISEIVNKINNEINAITNEYQLVIIPNFVITVKYEKGLVKQYTVKPIVTLKINRNNNILSIDIDNTRESYEKKNTIVLTNYLNPIKISVYNARYYSLLSVGILAPISIGLTFYYINKYGVLKRNKNFIEKYKRYIIKGEMKDLGKKPLFSVKDPSLLVKLAKIYRKPIVFDEKYKAFYLVLDDITYIYRSKNSEK